MRRYAVLSVFVFLLSLFVSCSLIEPSEKKASLAIGLNVSLPESSFLQANSASHLLQFDEEPHIEDEEFNFIEYTADVTITWDGGVSMGSGKIKRAKRQEELGDGNKASGTVAVINLPMNKTLFALIEIKDSDGDVLYSANKTLILAGEVTPITIDLAYSVDADGNLVVKPLASELNLIVEYDGQTNSPYALSDNKPMIITCLDADNKVLQGVTYEWTINGTALSDGEDFNNENLNAIELIPAQNCLKDLKSTNYIECLVKYSDGSVISGRLEVEFDFTPSAGEQYLYIKNTSENSPKYNIYSYDAITHMSGSFQGADKFAFSKNNDFVCLVTPTSGNFAITEYSYENDAYTKKDETQNWNEIFGSVTELAYDTNGDLWIYGSSSEGGNKLIRRESSGAITEVSLGSFTSSINKIAVFDNYFVYTTLSSIAYRKILNESEVYSIDETDVDSMTIDSLKTGGITPTVKGLYPYVDSNGKSILYILLNGAAYPSEGPLYFTGYIAFAELTAENGFTLSEDRVGSISLSTPSCTWDTYSNQYNVYSPYGENVDNSFYNPLGFLAIKDDELYITDAGIYKEEDSDYKHCKLKSRIVKFNLKQKVISGAIENSSIVIDVPSSSDALSGIKFD